MNLTVLDYHQHKFNLKNPNRNIALGNLNIYYTWKNIKSAYNNNKLEISAPTWNDTFDLPDFLILLQTFKTILNLLSKT